MITHTISVPELTWTIFCLIGLIYAVRLFTIAVNDIRYIREETLNGLMMLREYAANTTALTYAGIMINQLVYVVLGAIYMMLPPATPGHIAPTTYAIAAVFIMGSAFKTVLIFFLERRKLRIIEMIREYDARVR